MPHSDSLERMWEEGLIDREQFVRRAREVCSVTLPYLAPDLDGGRGTDLVRPLSILGARAVNNLSAKLSTGMFPPQAPFFRYDPDVMSLRKAGIPEERFGDVKLALSQREKAVQSKLDRIGFRSLSVEAFLHLVVAGNYLLHQLPDGRYRGFRLDQFQIIRDGEDKVERLLVREITSRHNLDTKLQLEAQPTKLYGYANRDQVDIYTYVSKISKTKWETYQEIGGVRSGETLEISDLDLPWIPLRMVTDANEDYGRSMAEAYLGPLEVLEAVEQAIVEYTAIASRVVPWIDPASGIRPDTVATAENGKPIIGNGDRMGFLSVDKLADIQVAFSTRQSVSQELRQVFLLLTPFRDAERVTQEEIQQTVAELTESLGGPYATLATEFQLPLVQKTVRNMLRLGELERVDLLDNHTTIKIVTGLDAIGRSRDEAKLQSFILSGQQGLGPELMAQHVNPRGYLTALAAAKGLDPESILLSEEVVQQQQQAAQQASFRQAGASEIVKQGAAAQQAEAQEEA